MSEKQRQKKDHKRKDKDRQAMRAASGPRTEQAPIRFGEQKRADHPDRRRGDRDAAVNKETE